MGAVCGIIARMDEENQAFVIEMDLLNRFLRAWRIPQPLCIKVSSLSYACMGHLQIQEHPVICEPDVTTRYVYSSVTMCNSDGVKGERGVPVLPMSCIRCQQTLRPKCTQSHTFLFLSSCVASAPQALLSWHRCAASSKHICSHPKT